MKLLKLESGSRSGPNTGERNSVSRARCKRQSKDLMQWMEETSTAVEKRGKDRPIWQRKTTVQHQGHGVAPATPRKKTEWKAGTLAGCCCRSGHFARTGHGLPYGEVTDRKSTRLNSSHVAISYAVFCLKKKKEQC